MGERDTASPRGRYWGTPSACPVLEAYIYKNTHLLASDSPRRHYRCDPDIRGGENTSFTSSSEAYVRSMAQQPRGRSVSFPLRKHGYIRNLRHSSSWELRTASPRGRYGERYTHATMLRGVQANFAKKAALSQLYQAKGVAPGTVDGCQ